MLICFFVIVASPLYPHSRLSWFCTWTSFFVHVGFHSFLLCLLPC